MNFQLNTGVLWFPELTFSHAAAIRTDLWKSVFLVQPPFIFLRLRPTMPAKSLGTLTSISKVKTNHPPLPHGTMLVYYQTG